jgi:hypothetical protein
MSTTPIVSKVLNMLNNGYSLDEIETNLEESAAARQIDLTNNVNKAIAESLEVENDLNNELQGINELLARHLRVQDLLSDIRSGI